MSNTTQANSTQVQNRVAQPTLPGASLLRGARRLLVHTLIVGVIYSMFTTASRGSGKITLNLHPSPFVYLALAGVFFATISWVMNRAHDEATALRAFRRSSWIVVAIALGSLVIAFVWFFNTPITGWPFENSWIAPFPFGTVTVDNPPVQ